MFMGRAHVRHDPTRDPQRPQQRQQYTRKHPTLAIFDRLVVCGITGQDRVGARPRTRGRAVLVFASPLPDQDTILVVGVTERR